MKLRKNVIAAILDKGFIYDTHISPVGLIFCKIYSYQLPVESGVSTDV